MGFIENLCLSNKKLKQNLKNRTNVYEAASETKRSIKVIVHFSEDELRRVLNNLSELKLGNRDDIALIDASNTNKASGSNA